MRINKIILNTISFYFVRFDSRLVNFKSKLNSIKLTSNKNKTVIFLPYRFNHSTVWFEYLLAFYFKSKGYSVKILFAGKNITICDGINYRSRLIWLKERINLSRSYAYSKIFNVDLVFFEDIIEIEKIKNLKRISKTKCIDEIFSFISENGIHHGQKVFESVCRFKGSSNICSVNDNKVIRSFFLIL